LIVSVVMSMVLSKNASDPGYRLRIAILGRSRDRQRQVPLMCDEMVCRWIAWHGERHIDRFNPRDCDHFHLVRGDQAADFDRQVPGSSPRSAT
jgi:hypothetical protein